jgi:hypothetical protein
MSKQSDLISVSQGAAGDPLFIDTANNRVGVGTTTVDSLLHLQKFDATAYSAAATDGQVGVGPTIYLENTANANNTVGGQIVFGMRSTEEQARIGATGGDSPALTFGTADVERARIDALGSLLVGTATRVTDGSNTLENLTLTPTYSWFATNDAVYIQRPNNTDGNAMRFARGAFIVGSITVTASSTAFNTSSDYRLKENVVPLAGAVDRLAQIPVHRFNFIVDPDRTVDGFLAHEVQAFVPECVTGEKDQVETVDVKDEDGNVIGTEERPVYQGIDQSKLVPLLTAALQEALQKIDALETRISALETN